MQLRVLIALAVASTLVVGCKGTEERPSAQTTDAQLPPGHVPIPAAVPTDLQPLTQALLDSGNAAFRQKDYDAALAFYGKARDAQPAHAAPWFGTYMVAQATKNTVLADSALRMVRERAPEMQAHPGGTTAPGTMPGSAGAPPSTYSPHQAPSTPKGAAEPPSRS